MASNKNESKHPLAACRPLGDRVVVLRDSVNRKTDSGIVLPDNLQAKQNTGVVVSVGPGRKEGSKLVPVCVTPGDRVLITGFAGLEISSPGVGSPEDDYVILREEDILALL